jgi:uncharacterized protein (DUF1800 family)
MKPAVAPLNNHASLFKQTEPPHYVEAPALIAAMALGPNASDNLLTHMTRAESPAQAATLMLTSPEFQRR